MNDQASLFAACAERPALPLPGRTRWQPLRLGLVELFHYDSEEFWFRDGHLLLRGNNGTGKSKVLALTLPFLLDAQLKPSRLEPDGDSGKRMSWNLLMNTYDRRTGNAWIEFGRVGEDGKPRFLTLGAGLSAVAARPQVDSWYFIIDDQDGAPRINQDLWLTSEQRVVLTRERLRELLHGRGHVFDNARSYRRAVDERLFHLGEPRYAALMDTLIQLRQPQLSKKPDEAALSNALSEALPPLAPELLTDVADAMGQLEEDRHQIERYQGLSRAVERFERRYRIYAGTQSRRQARALRAAQTELDNASRLRNEAKARLEAAEAEEERARIAHAEAERALKRDEARRETLLADPAMQDANRLEIAAKDVEARRRAETAAKAVVGEAERRLARDATETQRIRQRVAETVARLRSLRQDCAAHAAAAGLASRHNESPLATLSTDALARLPHGPFDAACAGLRALVVERRERIVLLRRRHADVSAAEARLAQRQELRDSTREAAEAAVVERETADAVVEREGQQLVEAWERHFTALAQLTVGPEQAHATLTALADWVRALNGNNPARDLLQRAQQQSSLRLAQRQTAVDAQRQALEAERAALEDERARLQSGADTPPPPPHTRDTNSRAPRAGAPFWQLLDFRESVISEERAGLEAALEAAGLLDAWVSPDGRLQTRDGGLLWHDTQVVQRRPTGSSLAGWLQAAVPSDCAVPARVVDNVLAGIACGEDDPADAETWIASDGRFRLGALAGAWAKPDAVYIGYAARELTRARRLAALAERLTQLSADLSIVEALGEQLARDEQRAADEWRLAPADEALRKAHLEAAARARDAQAARERLTEAERLHREAEQAHRAVCQRLETDAADLSLPTSLEALPATESALDQYHDTQAQLAFTARDLRLAVPDLERHQRREAETQDDLKQRQEHLATAIIEAEEAATRLEVLREAVGAKVEALQQQLEEARRAVLASREILRRAGDVLRDAGEARAVAGEQARTADTVFLERSTTRSDAIAKFQRFAATGLLSAAWPDAPLPDMSGDWTIDPALTLARRTEQALSAIKDDDEAWSRVQREIAGDLTELHSELSALGHQAQSQTSDFGLIVHMTYQNRLERPDRLAARLAAEISQRSELLTAKERTILENHLQAEIATEIQRLLQSAEAQRQAINAELHRRPTSTGVRYRLLWQPLTEEEGAPVGLEAARKRLLNTNPDLWSAEDRRVVGTMLQQRIAAERERADSGSSREGGGSLAEQLARALDYRRWHRFRVERWQDGSWRKLSGPASSGERALGLTVPLFAAVASFYRQSNYALAPRLMLLDEAFAGIDDAARAHCMGLIREFDLDFVITSEREWACYAELPSVSICQLQRKEGIDAVFVSRWTWDGKARRHEPDPNRRFAPA